MAAFEPAGIGSPFSEDFCGNHDAVARVNGPESFIEHPVGVACECEAVVWIVVAAFGELMDVRGFNDRSSSPRVRAIAG